MPVMSSCEARDHTKIAYEMHGDPAAAKKVLLIHSLAMDHAYWRPVGELLDKAGVCAVAPDCRGHGASGKPKGPYFATDFADDMNDLFNHLKWPEAVVAGSSMGGSVALTFAARHTHRVAGLALIDTTAWYGKDAEKAWTDRANAAKAKGLASLIEFQLTRWFGDDFRTHNPELVQSCIDAFLANDVEAYAATCRMLGEFDQRRSLPLLKMPVRIVVGEEDYATPPAMAEDMHAAMEQSSFRLLPEARHLTPLERPEEVAEEILATLRQVHG